MKHCNNWIMKAKTVTSRRFAAEFRQWLAGLAPGERITITERGKPLGEFTKACPAERSPRRPFPDFLANIRKLGTPPGVGQKLIDEICGKD